MKNKLKVYVYSALSLSAIAIALRTLLMLTQYDPAIGYYDPGIVVSIFRALCGVIVLWVISLFFFIPRTALASPEACASTPAERAFGLGMILTSLPLVLPLFAEFRSFDLLLFLSALLGGIYLALPKEQFKTHPYYIYLAFFPIITLLLAIFRVYLDMSSPLNGPVKIHLLLALTSAMLPLLHELRALLGRPLPRVYAFTSLLAILLIGTSALPDLIALATGNLTETAHLPLQAYTFFLFLYFISRTCTWIRRTADPMTES